MTQENLNNEVHPPTTEPERRSQCQEPTTASQSIIRHGKKVPKKNEQIRYRLQGEAEDRTGTCLGRGGRASSSKTWHYINIHDNESNTDRCISVVDDVEMWEPIAESSEALICKDEVSDMFKEPKRAELQKWKDMNVYSEVENTGQQSITTRWVCTERMKAGKIEAKARLCARGCEDVEDVPTDSPTCERDNVRLMLSIAMSRGWSIHSVDIKSAYLQGETLDRDIFLVPPKEADTQKLWKLKKCVYGINDAGRKWYNQFRKDLLNFGAQISKLDQAVFFKHDNGELSGIMVLHVDDTLWAGNELFAS